MRPDPVDRDADELCIQPPEFRQQLLIKRQLIRTDRAPVLRVEDEDDGLPPELRERD
jgi:hypothetical protein